MLFDYLKKFETPEKSRIQSLKNKDITFFGIIFSSSFNHFFVNLSIDETLACKF